MAAKACCAAIPAPIRRPPSSPRPRPGPHALHLAVETLHGWPIERSWALARSWASITICSSPGWPWQCPPRRPACRSRGQLALQRLHGSPAEGHLPAGHVDGGPGQAPRPLRGGLPGALDAGPAQLLLGLLRHPGGGGQFGLEVGDRLAQRGQQGRLVCPVVLGAPLPEGLVEGDRHPRFILGHASPGARPAVRPERLPGHAAVAAVQAGVRGQPAARRAPTPPSGSGRPAPAFQGER